jgi:hypothetical protein
MQSESFGPGQLSDHFLAGCSKQAEAGNEVGSEPPNGFLPALVRVSSRCGVELREACRSLSGAERPAGLRGVERPAGLRGVERPAGLRGVERPAAFGERWNVPQIFARWNVPQVFAGWNVPQLLAGGGTSRRF